MAPAASSAPVPSSTASKCSWQWSKASNVAGPDHVGIALDYSFDTGGIETVLDAHADYWPRQEYPGGSVHFMPPEELPQIVEILLRRGFSDSAITGLLGGNFLRVAQQVWK